MMKMILSVLILLTASLAWGEDPGEYSRTLGAGIVYSGGQVRWSFGSKKAWSAELRVLTGSVDSNHGSVTALVTGLRGYRHFWKERRIQPYLSLEGAHVYSRSGLSGFDTSGFAFGGAAGAEYYILSRLSVGLDLGPYYFSLRQTDPEGFDSGIDLVFNAFVNFYLF